MPKVSVIIPCYNASGCVGLAIESVRAQTFSDWEIVVVDDCSRDDSVEVVAGFAGADERIRLIKSQENRGPSAARNTAIEESRGEWICVLDADDTYRPDRIARLISHAEAHALDFVADNQVLYDSVAKRTSRVAFDLGGREFVELNLEMLFENDYPGISFGLGLLKPVMRRSFLTRNGLRYPEDLRMGEDFALYATALAKGARAHLLGAVHYVYTEQLGSVSRAKSAYTNTDQNWAIVLDRNEAFDERFAAAVTGRQRDAIRRRGARLRRELRFVDLRRRFLAARSLPALLAMVAHPSFWERLARRLLRRSKSPLRIRSR